MDKRWRNLGILVLVVVVVVFLGYIFFLQSPEQKIGAVMQKNSYTKADFDYSVSSYSSVFPSAIALDFKNLSDSLSGEDKLYLKKVLEINEDKNVLLGELSQFLQLDIFDMCDNYYAVEESISNKMNALEEKVNALGLMKSSFSVDLNKELLEFERNGLDDAFVGAEYACFDLLVSSSDISGEEGI